MANMEMIKTARTILIEIVKWINRAMICENLRRCARLFLDVKCIRRGNKTHNISSCSCSKCFKCVNCVAHSKTLPTHLQIYGTHCAIIGKAGPRKWTIIHIKFLIYLHFYYHQPPKTRRRQRKQNEYFISRRFLWRHQRNKYLFM